MFPNNNLPEEQRLCLTQSILECHTHQTLFLLGTTTNQKKTCSVFNNGSHYQYVLHYFILSLVEITNGAKIAGLQDKIENTLQHHMPATVMVLDIQQFNNWLSEGQPFACTVMQNAERLHDHGYRFNEPASINLSEKKYFSNNLMLVNEFLTGAELYHLRKQHHMVAFMLHQAAEHALRTLLLITCGLWINTHNLDKLIRYCSMATADVAEVFHRDSPKEKQLLSKLQSAYIDVRYKEYSISEKEITELFGKVNRIITIVRSAEVTQRAKDDDAVLQRV